MRTPRSLDIEITAKCNLSCRYCYFFENEAVTYSDLPLEEWVRFFKELGKCRVMEVTLQGGEPFFRKDLKEIIDSISSNRMRYSILSNGSLITGNIAQFIAETGRCNEVQISLDGPSPEIHDANRGKGSFKGAVNGIRTLQENKIPVGVRVTITRNNVHHLFETAKFILEDLKLPGFGTNSAGYFGFCRQNEKDMMLTVEDRVTAMEALLALSEKYPGCITASAGPLAEAKTWSEMERARKNSQPPLSYGGHLTGCGCPSEKLAVRADGVLVPCVMLAHMELGRINRDPLIEVWQHSSHLNNLRARHRIPLAEFPFCSDCPYTPYCTGNCPGLAYTLTGNVNHPSPDACLRSFLDHGGRLTGS